MSPHAHLTDDARRQLRLQLHRECDAADHAVFAIDGTGCWLYSNDKFHDLVGYDADKHLGEGPPYRHTPEQEVDRWQALLDAWQAGQLEALGVKSLSVSFQHSSGRVFPVLLMGRDLHNELDEADAAVLVVFDLSQTDPDEEQRSTWLHARLRMLEESIQRAASALSDAGLQHSVAPMAHRDLSGLEELTRREREVFDALVDGQDVAGVARALFISPHTARNHLKAIFRKLGVRSQLELLRRYSPIASR